MEVTDLTWNDGRGQLQHLRRMLVRAATESKDNAAKNLWLTTVLNETAVAVTAGTTLLLSSLTSDTTSNNTMPDLIHELLQHASEASIYGGDYATQMLSDMNDVVLWLAA